MAVTELDAFIRELPSAYPTGQPAVNTLDLTMTAPSVAADGVQFTNVGRDVVIIQNTDVGAQTFTVVSNALQGRTQDITTYSLGIGESAALAFPAPGWNDASGKLKITMSAVTVKVGVLRLPRQIF
jgi:hypothetical protein